VLVPAIGVGVFLDSWGLFNGLEDLYVGLGRRVASFLSTNKAPKPFEGDMKIAGNNNVQRRTKCLGFSQMAGS
jgi:hypothetical protein